MTSPQQKKLAEQVKKIVDGNKALQSELKSAVRQVEKADASLTALQAETKG